MPFEAKNPYKACMNDWTKGLFHFDIYYDSLGKQEKQSSKKK